jgi:hypothetical protein
VCDEDADLFRVRGDERQTSNCAAATAQDRRRLIRDGLQHPMDILGQQLGCGDLSPVGDRGVFAPARVIGDDGVVLGHQLALRSRSRPLALQ